MLALEIYRNKPLMTIHLNSSKRLENINSTEKQKQKKPFLNRR
jgi:hypothetical protein